jgi:adenylylsulfate kinase
LAPDRREKIQCIGEMATLFLDARVITPIALIWPFRSNREWLRSLLGKDHFIEIYCRCPVEVCKARDVKGFYEKPWRGEILEYTGVSSPYDEPLRSDLKLDTPVLSLDECTRKVVDRLRGRARFSQRPEGAPRRAVV